MDLMNKIEYTHMNGLAVLTKTDYVGIPPIGAIRSSLKQDTASKEDYDHVINVYETFKCSNWKDYTLAYLKSDVLLLSDVFEHFRTTCTIYYRLGPANYLTSPSLAWDAMLLRTRINANLMGNADILLMIEK